MTLQISPQAVDMTAIERQIADVKAEAKAADERAANAQQMVRNRDPRLSTVEGRIEVLDELADTLAQIVPAAEVTHAAINKRIDEIQLKPGPSGPTGSAGPAGKDGAQGPQGAPGTPADMSRVAALEAAVTALQALKVAVGYGVANLPASLGAGATTNVTVMLSKDMGSATYSVGYGLSGGTTLLGQLRVVSIVSQTRTTVTLAVKNEGLAALLNLSTGTLSVVAARDA